MTGFHTALTATINSPRNHALPFSRGTITQCVDANQGGLHDVDMLFYCTVSWKMEGHHMKPLSIMQVNRVLLYASKDRLHQTLPVTCSLRYSMFYRHELWPWNQGKNLYKIDDADVEPRIPWFELWQKLKAESFHNCMYSILSCVPTISLYYEMMEKKYIYHTYMYMFSDIHICMHAYFTAAPFRRFAVKTPLLPQGIHAMEKERKLPFMKQFGFFFGRGAKCENSEIDSHDGNLSKSKATWTCESTIERSTFEGWTSNWFQMPSIGLCTQAEDGPHTRYSSLSSEVPISNRCCSCPRPWENSAPMPNGCLVLLHKNWPIFQGFLPFCFWKSLKGILIWVLICGMF